jgi:hypothetical protein
MRPATVPLQPGAYVEQPTVVFGLQIHNARLAQLTKRVLIFAIISMVIVAINFILGLVRPAPSTGAPISPLYGGLATLACGLLVPCCGYWGAKNSDKTLTFAFCCCNGLGCLCNIVAIVSMFLVSKGLQQWTSSKCEPGAETGNTCPSQQGWKSLCPNKEEHACWKYLQDDILPNYQTFMMISIIVSIPAIILQCLSFYFGKELYDTLNQGGVIVQPARMPLVATTAVQPVQAHQVQPVPSNQQTV